MAMNADRDTLQEAPNVGPNVAEDIDVFFHRKRNREVIKGLPRAGVKPAAPFANLEQHPRARRRSSTDDSGRSRDAFMNDS